MTLACFNVPEDSVLSSLSTSIIPSNLETTEVTRDLDVPDELEALWSFYIFGCSIYCQGILKFDGFIVWRELRGVKNSLGNIPSISEHLSCPWHRYSSGTWGIINSSLPNVLWDERHSDIACLRCFKKACVVARFQLSSTAI
jgi:hypothetical protein